MVDNPTDKQAEVYRLITNHIELFGFQPSYAELAKVLSISKKAVVDRMKQLEMKGLEKLAGGRKERATQFYYANFKAMVQQERQADVRKTVWAKLQVD